MAALHRRAEEHESASELDINPVYVREMSSVIPRYRLAEHGVLPRTALQVVKDELILDGNARLNLATFVTTTTGSSEACMLGGMALLWRWRARRRAAGLDASAPNLVMGSNVQVCWEKFCRYWEVEPRYVPMVPGRYHL